MKLNLFKSLLNKINKFALQRNASKLEEKGIITNEEAIAIYEGKIKSQKELYKYRSRLVNFSKKEENGNAYIITKKR